MNRPFCALSKGFFFVFFCHTNEIRTDIFHFLYTGNDFTHLFLGEVDRKIYVEHIISVAPVEMLSGNQICLL